MLKLDEKDPLRAKFASFIEAYKKSNEFSKDSLSDFIKNVISSFKIKESFSLDEDGIERALNIDQFEKSADEFATLNKDASLGDFLESITLSSDTDNIGDSSEITIATIHAVKGLEFKVVFVVGVEEGTFPISRAFNSDFEMQEERRLMYVALTRAEEKLYITSCDKRYMYGKTQYMPKSRFIKELGLSLFSQKESFQKPEKKQEDISFNFKKFVSNETKTERRDYSVYRVGQTVEHTRFGVGQIIAISDDGLVGDINFEDFGVKSLMLDLAPLTIIEK